MDGFLTTSRLDGLIPMIFEQFRPIQGGAGQYCIPPGFAAECCSTVEWAAEIARATTILNKSSALLRW
jgi:hypothetical protein